MKAIVLITLVAFFCACQGNGNGAKPYVLVVPIAAYVSKGADEIVEKIESDTVEVPTALAAYSKGIQKYAAVLMHVEQFPDSIKEVKALSILDDQGNDIVPSVPQHQRDSVIMHFIQFARRSNIPYYDRVKDFELKLMKAR
ncbi:hypothetical protein [Parapedobacter sp. 10938]|uniref:hypothetical protein n=1 Tax=Parapedobacter flavus TaxID=3110225 RepID=UPI002DBE5A8B|nr:hypothetical protein [Parapedobacter sp. 10938]MEC3878890.1 hypothetical protein [Parapedobacter sp. 10938]